MYSGFQEKDRIRQLVVNYVRKIQPSPTILTHKQPEIRAKFRIQSFLVIIDVKFPCFFATKPIMRPIPVPVMEPTAITITISKAFMLVVFLSIRVPCPDVNFYFQIIINYRIFKNKRQ